MGVREQMRWWLAIGLICFSRAAAAAPPAPPAASPKAAPAAATAAPKAAPAAAPAAPAATPAATAPAAASPAAEATPAPAAAKPKPVSPAAALRAATQMLASASPSEVRQGLLALAELSGDGPARALADRLRAGLPPALLGDAIDVAVQLGSPRAIPALTELLQHRRPALRKHAISALAALKAKTAHSALLAALDDPDGEVRRAALDALAELKVTRALPTMLALVGRGQPGALQAVGKLAGARELSNLIAQAPSGDVTPLKPALQAWLSDANRAPAHQLELIAAMTKVASPSARTYLVEWLDAAKTAANPRVRTALFAAIKQLDDAAERDAHKTKRTVVQGVAVPEAQPKAEAPSKTPANTRDAAPAQIARAAAPAPVPAAGTAVRADNAASSPAGAAR
jgi:HEAT repeat protein